MIAAGIALLLSDIVMPGMSGIDFWKWLRQRHPEAKCLFMSGYSSETELGQGVGGTIGASPSEAIHHARFVL
jgi:DNA-binding NarL/FixJ family response regulator